MLCNEGFYTYLVDPLECLGSVTDPVIQAKGRGIRKPFYVVTNSKAPSRHETKYQMRHPLSFFYQRRPVKQRNEQTNPLAVLRKLVYFVRLCLILAVTSLYSFLIRNLFAVVGVRSRKPLDIDFFASKLSSKITDSRAILVNTLGQKISILTVGLCPCKVSNFFLKKMA